MKPFRFVQADSVASAGALLASGDGHAMLIAGGTDLLGEVKEGTAAPDTLVSVERLPELRGIEPSDQGLRIGALTTVSEIERDRRVAEDYVALAQAASVVATPQIRNVGTLGGNLCQRPRCWYYRSPLFHCRKKGGDECFAIDAYNKYHAILSGGPCVIVHPSDLAVALVALDAKVSVDGPRGQKVVPVEEFFVGPDQDVTTENILGEGDVLTEVLLPDASAGYRSTYLKAKEREAMDFALASVAVALDVSDGSVRDARIALGGVAPVPLRVPHAEGLLRGQGVSEVDADAVGQAAVSGARPLRDNGFKVRLAASLVGRAVRSVLSQPGS